MLASGTAVFAALLAAQGVAEFETGARLDTRVGQAPTGVRVTPAGQAVQAEQNQLMVSATPILGLRWAGEDSELRVLSDTRILWRPVPLFDRRPLFLEVLDISHLDPAVPQPARPTLVPHPLYAQRCRRWLVARIAPHHADPASRRHPSP